MITTNALHIIRGLVFIEGRGSQVKHTIVERLVLQDMVDSLCLGHRLVTHRLRHEHSVVQVTFVHLPHIKQTEHNQGCCHIFGTQLTILEKQQASRTNDDNPERAPAVSRKHSDTHLCQVLHQRCQLIGRNLTQRLYLIVAEEVGEEHLGHQGKKQRYATRQGKRHIQPLGLLLQHLGFFHYFLQGQHRQQGDGELGNNKDGCHRTELGIHRHVVQEEVGERHKITTPRQKYR